MEFESVEHLNQVFTSGNMLAIPEVLVIDDVVFERKIHAHEENHTMLEEGRKEFVIYKPVDPKYTQNIALAWGMSPNLSIVPLQAVAINNADTLNENQNIIGDHVDIDFKRFGKTASGKVDTGAQMSSLHTNKWGYLPGKERIEIQSPLLSDNIITLDVVDHANVRTSEGTEIRPVVALDVTVGGVDIPQAQFNLNDRSEMQDPILVGQNILEQGKFLVDPSQVQTEGLSESESLVARLQDMLKETPVEATQVNEIDPEKIRELYEYLLESNVSFQDVMRHLMSIAYTRIENTQ